MIYAAQPAIFHGHVARSCGAVEPKAPLRPGFLRRLFDAIFESRARSAERAAEAYLARTGGRFTDSIEREINDRYVNGDWNLRR